MDFLVELVLTLLFEVPVETAMESRRLKTWVKTTIFSVLGGGVTLFLVYLSVYTWQNQNTLDSFFVTLIAVVFALLVIFGAIRGHKRNWKH